MILKLELLEYKWNFTQTLIYKKLFCLSKILKIAGENINYLYTQREKKISLVTKPKIDLKLNEILEEKLMILQLINKSFNRPQNFDPLELVEKLKSLRDSNASKNSILFNPYLKIMNYKCKIEEKLLFSMYAENVLNKVTMKFPFINNINEIYFFKKSKENIYEKAQIVEIADMIKYNSDFNIDMERNDIEEYILSYLSLNNLDDDTRQKVLAAWIFRYKTLKFEKYIQLIINDVLKRKNIPKLMLYEDPILKNFLKFDYSQILDFNFRYVMSKFSKSNWLKESQNENQFKNKRKIIKFYNTLMCHLFLLLNQKLKTRNMIVIKDFQVHNFD